MSTKIIATVGPASFGPSIIKGMDSAGVDVFRINMSHTAVEDFETVYTMVGSWTDKPVCPDTHGHRYRTNNSISCLTPKDMKMMRIANRLKAPSVFLSFCAKAEDVWEIRGYFDHDISVVSKIENADGVRNLSEICEVSDEILIDRGDLSKAVALEKIAYAQEYIVSTAVELGTPVNVATNLMESMLSEAEPTRAEVNDIVKTLEAGASGLVLAGETAIGKHPVTVVRFMKKILDGFEEYNTARTRPELVDWLLK